jgi:hypothetical protein
MNGWRDLNTLSNQEENNLLNKSALGWLLSYSSKSAGGQLFFSHPITFWTEPSFTVITSISETSIFHRGLKSRSRSQKKRRKWGNVSSETI